MYYNVSIFSTADNSTSNDQMCMCGDFVGFINDARQTWWSILSSRLFDSHEVSKPVWFTCSSVIDAIVVNSYETVSNVGLFNCSGKCSSYYYNRSC